ncbi:beta-galactosidase [Gryllotalpicola koreensis]|uniref:beta-galactosidase n=1 Tax=Gryllotalpicola koreensis TaxID=993086 RepID=A0ABP7ZSW8_9MICO
MSRDRATMIGFGAAYYPEYRADADPVADLRLMRDAGFTVVRVGESVWSTWEPEEGCFDLDWLQPTLDAAAAVGIGVILGTPSYAAPMWLVRRHPEIAADSATGVPVQWGARQEMDFTNGAFRHYAERVIRRIVERYRDHPAIIGFQVDNEPGLRLLYNDGVFEQFTDWLRGRYGTVERLNEEWGLVYWSHRLTRWDELWRPDGNRQPQYDLAWRRFQAQLVTEYIGWQAELVRELAGPEQFVTTCISFEQPAVEDVELGARLDIVAGNAYYEMEDALAHPSSAPPATGPLGWIVRGAWAVSQLADLMYSAKGAPFLVTETNAGSIGFSMTNQSPYDGQWRQAAWLLVARGARMIEYWHWNTLRYGAETYWGGVLPHSGEPGRAYRELAVLGGELERAGGLFEGARPDADVAVLYDTDSKWALAAQPPLTAPGQFGDPESYRHIVAAFSRGLFDTGRQERLIRPQQLFPSRGGAQDAAATARELPVLVVPAFHLADDAELDFLAAYAEAGGHLVIGPRTADADREARARAERKPARLDLIAGAWYEEAANPQHPVPLVTAGGLGGGCALQYLQGLETEGAEVLARYEHPHFGRWAAVTTRPAGAGRVTVVGCVPDQELARSLARWLVPTPCSGWSSLPASVTVSSSRRPDGAVIHVVHNWGWEPTQATAPSPLRDAVSDARISQGKPVSLGAWDVRVLVTSPEKEER